MDYVSNIDSINTPDVSLFEDKSTVDVITE